MNSSRLSAFCDRALEAGWLLGVTITPIFFNVYSSRVFEPDKLTTLRSLALVMAVLWLVRLIEEWRQGSSPLRFSWKTPMVLPALLTMVVYLISSVFSLVPYTSFIGSYQRLQGTYTLFGYLVIFFAIITSLRTREQLSRLITVLILNSLPVSLYGIIQRRGHDPLPWAGDVETRVASNMGNAIFVAAYLIMIVPLTGARIVESFSDILHRAQARVSDILRASGYIFLIAVQLLTIWYSGSRGPWLGIVTAGFLFPYIGFIVLQRRAIAESTDASNKWLDVGKGVAAGLGILLASGAGLLVFMWLARVMLGFLGGLGLGFAVAWHEGNGAMYAGGAAAALIFGGLWLYFVVERKGWRWLWIGWGMIGLTIATLLLAINLPGPFHDAVVQINSIRRLAQITQLEGGTGKVRTLIWQGAIELISPHDPIEFPDGSDDAFNVIRPLVGYGPESMYVAYNSFYPAELGHYESRTASPDRSHNETLDSLVITGALGFVMYLFTFIGVFYWGFRWLGLLQHRWQLGVMLGLDMVSALILYFVGLQMGGAYLFVVAVPLGVLVGTVLYLTFDSFYMLFKDQIALPTGYVLHPHSILLTAILATVMGHFVEINFGIAIAATRTTFWALVGMLVVLGMEWVPGVVAAGNETTTQAATSTKRAGRGRKSTAASLIAPWLAAVLVLSFSSAFLMSTLAFDFVNNPDRSNDAGTIFLESLTTKYYPEKTTSYGALMIFLFTWLLFGVIGLGEYDREGLFDRERKMRLGVAVLMYASISLIGVLIFGNMLAGHQASLTRMQVSNTNIDQMARDIVNIAERLASVLQYYYVLIFMLLGGMGLVLLSEEKLPRPFGEVWVAGLGGVLLLASFFVMGKTNYDLIRADIIYKQGASFSNTSNVNEKQIAIAHYDDALKYVPREDYYNLFRGKAYLEMAQIFPVQFTRLPQEQQDAILAQWQASPGWEALTPAQQEEQLTQLKAAWAAQQQEQQLELFEETERVLTHAREINPLNTDHSANLARFYKSWATLVSMTLNSNAATLTEQEKADLDARHDDLLNKSLENYRTALILSPNNPIIWNELAQLYAVDFKDMEQFQETISHSLEVDIGFETTWMLLGDMRSSGGDIDGAIAAYQSALEVRSRFADHCTVRRVLGTLQGQQQYWEDAVATLEEAVELCERDRNLWEMYRVLAIAHLNAEQPDAAMQAALLALDTAPEAQKPMIQQLIDSMQVTTPTTPTESTP